MDNSSIRTRIHSIRTVASFALLGAVFAGTFFGWVEADVRAWGAAIGASGAVVFKLMHLL